MKGHEGSATQLTQLTQLKQELGHYVIWYNQERPQQGLDDATPDEWYFPQPLNKAPDADDDPIRGPKDGGHFSVPAKMLARLALNVALDAMVGAIPVLGDLFDFEFKANLRNARLIDSYLDRNARR